MERGHSSAAEQRPVEPKVTGSNPVVPATPIDVVELASRLKTGDLSQVYISEEERQFIYDTLLEIARTAHKLGLHLEYGRWYWSSAHEYRRDCKQCDLCEFAEEVVPATDLAHGTIQPL